MSLTLIVGVLLILTAFGFVLGRSRAVSTVGGRTQNLHSRPNYYGYYVALWCGLPALIILALWLVFEPRILQAILVNTLSPEQRAMPPAQLGLLLNDIRNLASGNIVSTEPDAAMQAAAERYTALRTISHIALGAGALAVAIAGLAFARQKIVPKLRARNQVEGVIKALLILCSIIAILTTIGIVLSLIVESSRFFF